MFNKLLSNNVGIIIISAILGLGLAMMFKRACDGDGCVIIKSPPRASIEGKIFGFDNKCYKYNPVASKCGGNSL